MRLLRIHLANFRGVTDRELTFAEHGVTVVEGPNESGKSSTIEAFGLLLDELDSSRKEAVRAVKPRHSDAAPEVEAEFRVGGYHLVYRKRWLRPLTELRVLAPSPETRTREPSDTPGGMRTSTVRRSPSVAISKRRVVP